MCKLNCLSFFETVLKLHHVVANLPVKMSSLPLPSGHLLGLSHDDSKFCEERFGVNSDKRLMSSILTSIDASKPWSRCTSATITDFFDDGNGECGRKRGTSGILLIVEHFLSQKNFLHPTNCLRVNLTLTAPFLPKDAFYQTKL